MSKGRLLVIEGLDGSGKATQAKLTSTYPSLRVSWRSPPLPMAARSSPAPAVIPADTQKSTNASSW